jgi:hypothetical protein
MSEKFSDTPAQKKLNGHEKECRARRKRKKKLISSHDIKLKGNSARKSLRKKILLACQPKIFTSCLVRHRAVERENFSP